MGNNYFRFQHFTVHQQRCAMKVGTDGTLLGAWAHGGSRVLDVGTGTGLIALMMAQRFPEAQVTGIDIDADAVAQARDNVEASPFAERMGIVLGAVQELAGGVYDAIVSNPPYFAHSLTCPDDQRTVARHTDMLSYGELMASVWRLLAEDGEFSVVCPFDVKAQLEGEAALVGLLKSRECAVRTTPRKPPRRYLLAFRKHGGEVERTEGVIEVAPGVRSPWYAELTKDFYLKG